MEKTGFLILGLIMIGLSTALPAVEEQRAAWAQVQAAHQPETRDDHRFAEDPLTREHLDAFEEARRAYQIAQRTTDYTDWSEGDEAANPARVKR